MPRRSWQQDADRTELKDLVTGELVRAREMAGLHAGWQQRCGIVPWERLGPYFRLRMSGGSRGRCAACSAGVRTEV